jgi:hypothetical protein
MTSNFVDKKFFFGGLGERMNGQSCWSQFTAEKQATKTKKLLVVFLRVASKKRKYKLKYNRTTPDSVMGND